MVKKGYFCVLLCIAAMCGICGCGGSTAEYIHTEGAVEETDAAGADELTETEETPEPEPIYIYVCGAVALPGVYVMETGSRICDLFQEAGGLTEEAAADYWNQARLLTDGEMIYVPTREEAVERVPEDWTAAGSQEEQKININTASVEELMTLPGIGEAKALAILAYRKENGKFSSIEELKEISGIKDGVFDKIKDYIVVN